MDEQVCSIGVDLGTTSAKAVAFDANGRTVASAAVEVTTLHEQRESAEQDPQAVVQAANDALRRAAADAIAKGYHIGYIGLSAAMHSLLPLDQDGKPLMRALIWMDNRAHLAADQLWQTPQGQAIYERTGTPVHAMAPLAKLLWLRKERSDIFQRAHRFVSLKEWLWYQWFGEWKIDVSMANATGLYNMQARAWDNAALSLAGITAQQLSEIVPVTYTRTGLRDDGLRSAGITAETICAIGSSDGVLANLAAGALDATTMVLTIGTSCALRIGSPRPVTDRATRAFCYTLDQQHYIIGGPSNSGGIVLEWLGQQVFGLANDTFGKLLADAEQAYDESLLCLPYAAGERAPLWNAASSATCHGLRLNHTRAHILRAAVEGLIFNAYWIAEGLFQSAGRPQRLITSGKVLEDQWIRQVVADVFGLPVVADSSSDASALGAAKIALVAAGVFDLESRWGIAQESAQPLQPAQHEAYQAKYQRFRQLAALLDPPITPMAPTAPSA
jgi:gluconokinase